MKPRASSRLSRISDPSLRAFASIKTVVILAVIAGGIGLLAYEWHSAHPKKTHAPSISVHTGHKRHKGDKTPKDGATAKEPKEPKDPKKAKAPKGHHKKGTAQ